MLTVLLAWLNDNAGGVGILFTAVSGVIGFTVAAWRRRSARSRLVAEEMRLALQQLGHNQRSIRIAAIYALEKIANNNPKEHSFIMGCLAAYVRERAEQSKNEAEDPSNFMSPKQSKWSSHSDRNAPVKAYLRSITCRM